MARAAHTRRTGAETGGLTDDRARELLARFVAGERAAFDRLVEAYTPMLFAIFLRRYRLSPDDAEDLYQEVLLQLALKADEIRNVRQWLTGTAARQAKKRIRRLIRDRNLTERYLEDLETRAPDPGHEEDVRDLVARGLGQLKDANRRLLELLYLEGLSYQEAADRLGWPIGSIGPRRGRALARLRRAVERLGTRPAA